jgi:2-polyprenyl-6-hydroxyphenyl methylase/3-demethylubiquinone-9 3-methyltransferase
MPKDYYAHNLHGKALEKCYAIAPPRVQQYLKAEIEWVKEEVNGMNLVLELGCGYGRVLSQLSPSVSTLVGIDTAIPTLIYGKKFLSPHENIHLVAMNAGTLGFQSNMFDAVVCIQNGISVFRVESHSLVKEVIRVTRSGGVVLFSTYAPQFWYHRLQWFRLQAEEGLIGDIDEDKTREGIIVCKDGFKATTFSQKSLLRLFSGSVTTLQTAEIDQSSIFLRAVV